MERQVNNAVVVDGSVAVKWLLEEEGTDKAIAAFHLW